MGEDDALAWQAEAACRGVDSAYFFKNEEHRDGGIRGSYRSICGNCPVKIECRDFAILYDLEGVWGGISEARRKQLYDKKFRQMLVDDAIESGVYISHFLSS